MDRIKWSSPLLFIAKRSWNKNNVMGDGTELWLAISDGSLSRVGDERNFKKKQSLWFASGIQDKRTL